MNDIKQEILDFINHDYSHTTFDTRLYELFCKHDEAVEAYIKVGRKFWYFDLERKQWRKLTVIYVRTGVMFITFDDEPELERARFIRSYNVLMSHAAEIHPYEISKILSEWYPDNNFAEICKTCKWDDDNGSITVDVIWEQKNKI